MTESQFYSIDLAHFVAIDVETTGFDFFEQRIIEVAAIKYHFGKEVERFHSLVNPEKAIPDHITRLTSIDNTQVKNAPIFSEIKDDLLDFLGQVPLIGHAVNFDCNFIESEIRRAEDNFKSWTKKKRQFHYLNPRHYDTLALSRTLLPFLPSFKLESVAEYYAVDLDAHRAANDAKATAEIFLRLTEEICHREKEPLAIIVDLLKFSNSPMLDYYQYILDAKNANEFDESRSLLTQMSLQDNISGKTVPSIQREEEQAANLLDENTASSFFDNHSKMAERLEQYEKRDEQVTLVKKIVQSFNSNKILAAEAGTGTGKSLAYLLPSILWAIKNRGNKGRVVISTNTKNLQEQLFYKDLPFIQALLEDDFQSVLLKGKTNYLCKDKWNRHLNLERKNLSDYEKQAILPLIYWANITQTGDISENNAFNSERNVPIWLKFVAENNYCYGRKCPHYNDCHLINIRNNAKQADIVVVNHSLLFTDIQSDNSIIGEYKHVVLDEAHNVERVATDYLGSEFNFFICQRFSRLLYTRTQKEEKGLLHHLDQSLELNAAKIDDTVLNGLQASIRSAKSTAEAFNQHYQLFFDQATMLISSKQEKLSDKIRYTDGKAFFADLSETINAFNSICEQLAEHLFNLSEQLYELKDDSFKLQTQISQDVKSRYQDIIMFSADFITLTNAGNEDYVFWIEPARKKDSNQLRLLMAPLYVDKLLHQLFFDQMESVILSSATLTVDHDFSHFKKRVGLNHLPQDRISTLDVGSPFQYESQSRLLVTRFLPDPNHQNFSIDLANMLLKLSEIKKNGILVLFTSYALMDFVFKYIEKSVQKKRLLVQAIHGSRSSIIKQMKQDSNTMVFGTDSFWEGVDLPGEALETLVITKLPFAVPSEPITAAKMDVLRKLNENPFMAYSVPEAIIKLRQGFGRLIRSKADHGDVIITDNRLISKRYGELFLNSLPLQAQICGREREFFSILESKN